MARRLTCAIIHDSASQRQGNSSDRIFIATDEHLTWTGDRVAGKPLSFSQRARLLVVGAFEEWFSERASSKGAALAFYTLFSLAPLLVIVIAIAGAIFGEDAARGAIFNELRGLVGPAGAEAVQLLLANARDPAAGLIATITAVALLIIGATTIFSELKDSLDELWHVTPVRQSGVLAFIRTRLLSFSLILVLVFLLLVSLAVSAALAVLEKFWGGYWQDAAAIFQPLSSLVSFAVVAALFAAIYKLLPQVKLSWRDVWTGAFLTAGLFILGKYLIGMYLGNSGVASSFGAAGSVIALLLWVYYSAQVFFLGAEFTRQYALWFGSLRYSAEHAIRNDAG
jgi:membrane protein